MEVTFSPFYSVTTEINKEENEYIKVTYKVLLEVCRRIKNLITVLYFHDKAHLSFNKCQIVSKESR